MEMKKIINHLKREIKNNISIYMGFVIASLILLLFQYLIGLKFSVINYFDEIIEILLLVLYLCACYLNKKLIDYGFLLPISLVVFLGILSNFTSGICVKFIPIIIDCLEVIKLYLIYLTIYKLTSSKGATKILNILYPIAYGYIFLAFCGLILGNVFDIHFFFKDEDSVRFGIKAYSFLAGNAGNFGYLIMGLFLIIQFYGGNFLKDKIIKIMALFLLLSTTKGPQILFVAIWVMLKFLKVKKITLHHLIIVGALGLVLGSYQIFKYLLNSDSARFILASTSVKIANNYFPIGSGFATFGSEMSRRYYSSLYVKYGFNEIYGLSENFSGYITDNYWPMLIAQTGYVGAISIGLLLLRIFNEINNVKCSNIRIKWALLALYITFAIGSIGSSYYNTATGVFCFMIVALVLKSNKCFQEGEYETEH